jgi:hypothetical protein
VKCILIPKELGSKPEIKKENAYVFGTIVTDTAFKDCFVFLKLGLKFLNQRTPFRL